MVEKDYRDFRHRTHLARASTKGGTVLANGAARLLKEAFTTTTPTADMWQAPSIVRTDPYRLSTDRPISYGPALPAHCRDHLHSSQ